MTNRILKWELCIFVIIKSKYDIWIRIFICQSSLRQCKDQAAKDEARCLGKDAIQTYFWCSLPDNFKRRIRQTMGGLFHFLHQNSTSRRNNSNYPRFRNLKGQGLEISTLSLYILQFKISIKLSYELSYKIESSLIRF